MSVKISVIMPVYNEEDYLDDSIQSFIRQTISSNCELICIDDGSTDSSIRIIEKYQGAKSANLTLLTQENKGSGQARNAGIAAAKGEYIAFLDADDFYPGNDVLERLYDTAINTTSSIVGGSFQKYDERLDPPFLNSFENEPGNEGYVFTSDGLMDYKDYQFEYGYQRFLFSKALLDANQIRFPDYLRYQDPPFMAEAMIAAGNFYALSKQTYTYRVGVKPITWTYRKAADLAQGIRDVGILAANNGLEHLYKVCVKRLCVEWERVFLEAAMESARADVFEELFEAKHELAAAGKQLGIDVERLFSSDSPTILEIKRAMDDAPRLRQENAELLWEINSMRSSNSWKIGSALMLIPGKIKHARDNNPKVKQSSEDGMPAEREATERGLQQSLE